jgi:type IV secretory pathway ATPase VirB11/archaellum biosynthesis ATPase
MPETKRMPDKPFSFLVEKEAEGRSLLMNCAGVPYYPSIEDSELFMSKIIDAIIEVGSVTTVTLTSDRNYVYPNEQVQMLNEIARIYVKLVRQKEILSVKTLEIDKKRMPSRLAFVRKVVTEMLKADPIGAYVYTLRELRQQRVELEKAPIKDKQSFQTYISVLETILSELERTKLVKESRGQLPGHRVGDRKIYREIFSPMIRPNFMYTRLMAEPPITGEEVDSYTIGTDEKSDVAIYRVPDKIQYIYHIMPPEFQLDQHEESLLDEARQVLAKYKPKEKGFVDPKRMRTVFFNISRDLLDELAVSKGLKMDYDEIKRLAKILVRLTVGFGLVEVLLSDDKVEDVYINSPIGLTPIFVKHADYGECISNIIPNMRDADAWASRFRLISGRALDEANPVMDTELIIPEARARVAVVQQPLSPYGLSFAFRRHRQRPWTLPLFMENRMISPLGAGLLWFLVDGSRTMLIAGTRGSGKSSLLGALMIEIMRKFRIITIEDTLELPTTYLRGMGYDILPMKVRSAIIGSKAEMSASDGIRTSLRLGDSCLIIGEVRSKETIALYEAMRIGALANVVAGTIHGDSPYGVFDRVVNDLGVPTTSFKATDIIVVCNKVRSPDMMSEYRRVVEIAEVRKHWTEDPMRENGFVTLMKYNAKNDTLEPTKELIEGGTDVIKSIAGNVREWAGNWDRVWENILLRSKVKNILMEYSKKNRFVIESEFVASANDQFHRIFNKLKEETGYPETKDVLYDFEKWMKLRIKSRSEQ